MVLNSKSAYVVSHASKPIPKPLQPVMSLLEKLSCKFLQFRWSRRKVPHVVLQLGSKTYSICYFGKDGLYRVFYPYPGGSLQERHDCLTPRDVIAFICTRSIKTKEGG